MQTNTTQRDELPDKLRDEIKKFLTNTWGWSFENGEWLDSTGELTGGVKDLEIFIAQELQAAEARGAQRERERIRKVLPKKIRKFKTNGMRGWRYKNNPLPEGCETNEFATGLNYVVKIIEKNLKE